VSPAEEGEPNSGFCKKAGEAVKSALVRLGGALRVLSALTPLLLFVEGVRTGAAAEAAWLVLFLRNRGAGDTPLTAAAGDALWGVVCTEERRDETVGVGWAFAERGDIWKERRGRG